MKIFSKVKKILRQIALELLPRKNIIVFESIPALSDNTLSVFNELVRRGYNKKYKMYWLVKNGTKIPEKLDNVFYLNTDLPKENKILRSKIRFSKCLISCNDFLIPKKDSQKAFYLTHGTALKSVRSYYNIPEKIDYCLVSSPNMIDVMSYELNFPKEKMVPLGLPRNDLLTGCKKNIKKMLNTECDKIIIWYPTFRQHKDAADNTDGKSALPIINDIDSALKLNECAKKNNILIVLKPHFAQNMTYIKKLNLSNIRFINDDFYAEHEILAYEFIGNCDAMITDYSSIYFDYLICNKPIAVIWEDIEEYKKNIGLVDNYEMYMSGAEKVYNLKEFIAFIDNLANGVDRLKEEREKINAYVNFANDGQNTKRVVDFIIEKAQL